MRMRILLIAGWLVVAHFAKAQIANLGGTANAVIYETTYVDVKGSPYLKAEWNTGTVTQKDGQKYTNVPIRYDSFRDELQFLRDDRTFVTSPAIVSEFYFADSGPENELSKRKFKNGFEIEGLSPKNYFHVIYEGKSLFMRRYKTILMEENTGNYGTNEQVKRFERKEEDYVRIHGQYYKLSKNRKDIFDYFGKSEDQMRTFIKNSELNIKNDLDLVLILLEFDRIEI